MGDGAACPVAGARGRLSGLPLARFRTPDGRAVGIGAVGPWSRGHLVRGLALTSAEARTRRFGSPRAAFTELELDLLTLPPEPRRRAFGALDLDRRPALGIGVARYAPDADDPHRAECAILVIDGYRGAGVGRKLMAVAALAAAAAGYRTFAGETDADNRPLLALARSLGAEARFAGGGRTRVALDLAQAATLARLDAAAGPLARAVIAL
jgi:GNAT superfamily N-acetyltransferase